MRAAFRGARYTSSPTRPAFDAHLDSAQHLRVHRLLSVLVALSVALFVLESPAVAEAKPKDSVPRATPTTRPTPTPPPTPPPPPPPPPTPTPTPTPTSTPTPPQASAYVDGIDVSYPQGAIDWGQSAAAGKRFAFIRAPAGTLTADTAYWTNRSGATTA